MRFSSLLSGMGIFLSTCPFLCGDSPAEIYQRRIIPLLQTTKPSSCSECHLQGVKLDDFLTSDPKKSFASLRARGWIDIDNPLQSKLLEFIAKKPESSSELMDQVRKSELEAISQWVLASVQDPESLSTPLPELNDLKLDEAMIRHTRKDQVLNRFVDVVWSQFERCANCHSPDRNAKQVEKNGQQMSWIVPNAPDETLQLLEERKLINIDQPNASFLKTKALGQDDHGGGIKFPIDGQTDREWGRFLEDFAAIKKARYKSSDDLQKFQLIRTWRTGLHLRLKDLTPLPIGQYAVVLLHHINTEGTVDADATAIGEGRVAKDGSSWSTSFMLLEPPTLRITRTASDWNALLKEGRYQLRWIVVEVPSATIKQILEMRASAQLNIDSLWKPGHSAAKSISFESFEPLN